jgi:hypothetical protein
MSNETVNQETGEITVTTAVAEEPVSARRNAFSKAQGVIEPPKKTKTATVRTRDGQSYKFDYAPLDAILECIRKPFAENGLYKHQYIVQHDGNPYLRTEIWHTTGKVVENDYPIISSGPTAQNFASGVTYARRYGLMLALGICAEEDDDANVADGNTATITPRGNGPTPPQTNRRPPPTTPVQQPNAVRDTAVETRNKVRAAIENARSTDELNHAWTEDDKTAVTAYVQGSDRIGDRVWATLMKEDADKRLKLVAEADEPGSAEPDYFDPRDQENVFGAR